MNITGTLRISRDGKGVMNIEQGGMVLAQTLDLGQNWAGAAAKGATINLNGGSLLLGAGGMTASGNTNTIVLNMNSGTLGTTAAEGWSSAYNMNLAGNVTVDTRQYDAGTKSYNDQASTNITLGGVLSGAGRPDESGFRHADPLRAEYLHGLDERPGRNAGIHECERHDPGQHLHGRGRQNDHGLRPDAEQRRYADL